VPDPDEYDPLFILSLVQIPMPAWIKGDVMDVRKAVSWLSDFNRTHASGVCVPRVLLLL